MIEEIERVRWNFPGSSNHQIARIEWDTRPRKPNRWIVWIWCPESGDVRDGAFRSLGTALRHIQRSAGYIV